MISVVMPLYNKEMYVESTILNVLSQTFNFFELIIVNDGSTDNSLEIVESFKDKRIKVINKKNRGVSSARNVGIKEAKYNYVAFLDADDTWLPNHLEVIVNLIKEFGDYCDLFVTNFARKYSDGTLNVNRKIGELPDGIVDNYFKEVLKKAIVHTSSVCISKKALVTGFNEKMTRGEDIDLWSRVARKYGVAYSNQTTSYYLIEAQNSCSYTLPEPHLNYVYYLDLDDCINKFDKRYAKSMLFKRLGRYILLDANFCGFCKLLKQQIKSIFK